MGTYATCENTKLSSNKVANRTRLGVAGLQLFLQDDILLVRHALLQLALQVIVVLDICLQPLDLLGYCLHIHTASAMSH